MSVHSNDGTPWQTKLQRLGERSAQDKDCVFNNLGHILNVEMLRELYHQLDGTKAVGIDGVTKEDYGANLEAHLEDLMRRIRRGHYRPQPARLTEIPKEDGSTRPGRQTGTTRGNAALDNDLRAVVSALFVWISTRTKLSRGA